MTCSVQLPLPAFDALPMGAHRVFAHTDDRLFAACGVRIAFTGRAGGASEGAFASLNCGGGIGDEPDAVRRNRELAIRAARDRDAACGRAAVGGAPVLLVPKQVHGTHLVTVRGRGEAGSPPGAAEGAAAGSVAATAAAVAAAAEEARAGADGIVVDAAGVAAFLCFADCLPLVIVAPTGAFAVVHAGWRGAVAHIAAKAAGELQRVSGVQAGGFNAYIGPHIHAGCFQVGEEVWDLFETEFGVQAVPDPRHVDLARAVTLDLIRAGLAEERIADVGICTKCNPDRYFSYRATSGSCGRHSAFAYRACQLKQGRAGARVPADEDNRRTYVC